MVAPILLYGAEIWGGEYCEVIERVHAQFCKYVINIGSHAKNISSPERMLPLFVNYISKCIKYWVKIIGMNEKIFISSYTCNKMQTCKFK